MNMNVFMNVKNGILGLKSANERVQNLVFSSENLDATFLFHFYKYYTIKKQIWTIGFILVPHFLKFLWVQSRQNKFEYHNFYQNWSKNQPIRSSVFKV